MTDERLAKLRRLCEAASSPDRGQLVEYCPSHDYGDPGFPPSECSACVFERDVAERKLASAAREALPALLDEVERVRRRVEALERVAEIAERALKRWSTWRGSEASDMAELRDALAALEQGGGEGSA